MAQGSIKKFTAKDGTISYRARADGGTDPATGKRRQPMESFRTRKEAEAWLREQQRRADRGEWVQTRKTTLGQWVAEWLSGAGARGRKESTLITYSSLFRVRLLPVLGHVPLARLTPTALERFFHELEQTAKPATARTLHAALRVCLADAERLRVVAANPLRTVRAASVTPPERQAWTPEQARRFLETLAAGEERTFWLLFLAGGLRIGEVLALKWADLDLERRLLHVRRTITMTRSGARIGETTKTGKARTLPLSAPVAALLRLQRTRVEALRAAHAEVWQDHDLVFPDQAGAPRDGTGIRRHLDAHCAAARVPRLTPHGLRHTAASLLAEHAPVAVARDVLGHANLAMTNTYVHASDGARRDGAEALARLFVDA
jgi:integrase